MRLERDVLLHQGLGEHRDGRLLELELGLPRLERHIFLLEFSRPRLERLILPPQLGSLRLGLLGLLVSCGSLRIALAVGSGQLEFQPTDSHLQG